MAARATAGAEAGALTPAGCIKDLGLAGCDATQEGLDDLWGVAASTDGRSAYVASRSDNAAARLDRDITTGALTPAGGIKDVGGHCIVVVLGMKLFDAPAMTGT